MTGDLSLYVFGSFAMGVVLAATELVLLRVRERAIWHHLGRQRDNQVPQPASGDDASEPQSGP